VYNLCTVQWLLASSQTSFHFFQGCELEFGHENVAVHNVAQVIGFWCPLPNIIVSGSAVAVEHVFSGGHNTISLQCASLWPETIKVLMLVKKKLHLMHAQAIAALQCWLLYISTLYWFAHEYIFMDHNMAVLLPIPYHQSSRVFSIQMVYSHPYLSTYHA
jgi:hypothetical protein